MIYVADGEQHRALYSVGGEHDAEETVVAADVYGPFAGFQHALATGMLLGVLREHGIDVRIVAEDGEATDELRINLGLALAADRELRPMVWARLRVLPDLVMCTAPQCDGGGRAAT